MSGTKMNEKIKQLLAQAHLEIEDIKDANKIAEKFAELIVKECVNKIETYEIYVGCSPAGELACEWTYNSLKSIRDDIKEHFGVE